MACNTRSGTLVGPGICRKWRPVWPGGWFFIDGCSWGRSDGTGQRGRETATRQAGAPRFRRYRASLKQLVLYAVLFCSGELQRCPAFVRGTPAANCVYPIGSLLQRISAMRIHSGIFPIVLALAGLAAPALADSVAVASGSGGTVIVNGKPCRVVTSKDGSNSTTVTTGSGGLSGSTTVTPGGGSSVTISPGGNSSSVAVGSSSSSSSGGGHSSAAAGSDCVIYRPEKK